MRADEIETCIREPHGRPLRDLASGKLRPVIIVDDLSRPTPVALLLPAVLRELEAAGIPRARVTLMLGTGTHGAATEDAARRKLGSAADGCLVIPHDDRTSSILLGRTSFGSRVEIDPVVARGDLLIAIGGIYPQNTAGFGGGAKAVLGILGRRSIEDLHFGHSTDDGRYEVENDFRRDIEEMAALAGLGFSISTLVDHYRRPVAVLAGDHREYYRAGVALAMTWFAAPRESPEDVVIANAYPMDVSATFMRSKGILPLLHTVTTSSRVLMAACSEGIGHHGLFPLQAAKGLKARAQNLRRQLRYAPASVPRQILNRSLAKVHAAHTAHPPRHDIICFVTSASARLGAHDIPGMHVMTDWQEVLRQIEREQGTLDHLSASVFVCSPLQVFTS